MATKYFTINRVKRAIEHLQKFDSNWVIVPLVLAVNGVNSREITNTIKKDRAGTDRFLNNYFSGALMGLDPKPNGVNTIRPRFSDIYSNMKNSGKGDDFVVHQGTKLWANVYSSRGYREMSNSRDITSDRGKFRLRNSFVNTWRTKISANFHFEELLVWLHAFNGLDKDIDSWEDLFIRFQERFLGNAGRFETEYSAFFHVNNSVLWEDDFLSRRPTNQQFQRELLPSLFASAALDRPIVKELNKIAYGPPGAGKSFYIENEVKNAKKFVTTFHPEYSYADFVGSFRPATENYGTERQAITYRFHPEVFLKAYVEAWSNPNENIFLVIEEINRGNPAAVFGDIFQLLDRDKQGYSEYEISCRDEIRHFLEVVLGDTDYNVRIREVYRHKFSREIVDPYSVLLLPNNFAIRATMNTSDQSLFPMDSAFKRRWSWQYIPIRYNLQDREICIKDKRYSWNSFLLKANNLIYEILETEDKCIGSFFVKSDEISMDEFRNKVLFYLWNDVLRDELPETKLRILPNKLVDNEQSEYPINFNDYFDVELGQYYVEETFNKLGISSQA